MVSCCSGVAVTDTHHGNVTVEDVFAVDNDYQSTAALVISAAAAADNEKDDDIATTPAANSPQRELYAWHHSRHMLCESPWQHLYQLSEKTEAALSRLDTLLPQLFVDSPDNTWDLWLQQQYWPEISERGKY